MSVDSTLKILDKIAEVESNNILDARLSRAAKVQGILKRRWPEGREIATRKKHKRKTSTMATSTTITNLKEFFESYKYQKPKTKKEKYFFYLSRNHILDTTDISMGSQLNLLPATVKEKLIYKNMQEKTVDYVDSKLRHILLVRLDTVMVFFYQKSISDPSTKYSMIINPFSTLLTKKKDTSLKSKIKEVYTMQILNNRQRVQREVVRFILDMHINKKRRFDPSNFPYYSEEDYKVKFWSHVLEELFSTSDVDLHWGDTVPKIFLNSSMKPKIDIRIIGTLGSSEPDLAVGEFSKSPTPSKMYHDKLKSVLITKKHLNTIINNTKSITTIPFLLIMGFTLSFLEMHFDSNQTYMIHTIASCSFPITRTMLENNGIENIINAVEALKSRVDGIKEKTKDYQRESSLEKMSTIMEGPSNIKPSYSILPVIWPKYTNTKPLDDDEYNCENEDGEEEGPVDDFNDEDKDVEEEGSVDDCNDEDKDVEEEGPVDDFNDEDKDVEEEGPADDFNDEDKDVEDEEEYDEYEEEYHEDEEK